MSTFGKMFNHLTNNYWASPICLTLWLMLIKYKTEVGTGSMTQYPMKNIYDEEKKTTTELKIISEKVALIRTNFDSLTVFNKVLLLRNFGAAP